MKNLKKYIVDNLKDKEISIENILVKYSLIIFIICITYAIFWCAIRYYPPAIINIVLSVSFLSILYFSSEKIQTEFLIQWMIFLSSILIFILSVLTWKTTPTLAAWFVALPLFSMLTLNKRKAIRWTLFSLILLILTYPTHKLLNANTNFCIQYPFHILFNIIQILGIFIFTYIVAQQSLELSDSKQKDIEQKNEDLKKIQIKLETTQKYKDSFFANISHEIRTPLNAIKGVSDLLSIENKTEEDKQLIKTLQSSTSHLLLLINNILEVSKLDQGKITLLNEKFNLHEIISTSFEMLRFESQKKNIDYTILINNNVPRFVIGDKQRLTQIIVNILGNAIKFTQKGGVTFNVDCIQTKHNEHNEEIAIIKLNMTDTGIGIKNDVIKNLFNEYYQADPTIALKFGGTGLGLNISKKLIELQDGNIEFHSELGKGSVVEIELPYKIVYDKSLNIVNSFNKIDFNVINEFSILIVDDNEANLLIEEMLFLNSNSTLNIETAANGFEAIQKSKIIKYNLILMDMQMPVLDGVMAASQIITDVENINNATPIFGLTADISTESYNKCINAGMKTVITKPFEMDTIFNEIVKYCIKNS